MSYFESEPKSEIVEIVGLRNSQPELTEFVTDVDVAVERIKEEKVIFDAMVAFTPPEELGATQEEQDITKAAIKSLWYTVKPL